MQIAALEQCVFSVSDNCVKTINNISRDFSASYTTHNRVGKKPLLEFSGTGVESLSFSANFSALLGVNVKAELARLESYLNNGRQLSFFLGKRKIGNYKWVITKLSEKYSDIDNCGNIISATVNITLNAYEQR